MSYYYDPDRPGLVQARDMPRLMRFSAALFRPPRLRARDAALAWRESARLRWNDYYCCPCVVMGQQVCGCYAISTGDYYLMMANLGEDE